MPAPTTHTLFTAQVPRSLHLDFFIACRQQGVTASHAIRSFMRDFVAVNHSETLETIVWEDFLAHITKAPMVEQGRKGLVHQTNWPEGCPWLFIYEDVWLKAALKRLKAFPELESRVGGLSRYTEILMGQLQVRELLVHAAYQEGEDSGKTLLYQEVPLWKIRSGTDVVINRVLAVDMKGLKWYLNKPFETHSPYLVVVIGAADLEDDEAEEISDEEKQKRPDVSDELQVDDADVGSALVATGESAVGKRRKVAASRDVGEFGIIGLLQPTKPRAAG